MPGEHSQTDFEQLAAAVSNRERFAAIFDDVAKPCTPYVFKLLALMTPQAPIAKALSHAAERGFLDALVERLLHANQLNMEVVAAAPAAASATVKLQALTQPKAGIVNTEAESKSSLLAMRRLCSIVVIDGNGMPVKSGTGFLVGPQTVITSYHVVRPLLDAQDMPLQDSRDRLKITFDAVNGMSTGTVIQPQEAWLVEHSRFHPLEDPDNQQEIDWTGADPEGFDSHLDFAVIRLSRTVGRERGFYTLDPGRMPTIANVGAQLTLWQFQNNQPLATSRGVGSRLWPTVHKSRLHHDANSSDGSSGGLLVDQEFKPVGLHQYGYFDAANKPLFNGAIPTACIARRGTALTSVVGLDAMWRLDSTDEPLIGREGFQNAVLRAIGGKVRIIAVAGAAKTGRSFTAKILRTMLGTAQHNVVEMSASQLDVTAHGTAMEILRACGAATVPALPVSDEAESAVGAWIRDELFAEFVRRIREHSDQRVLWLVVDDVDRYKIANTSTRTFLETLYAGMASLPELRVVLIGLDGEVPGADPEQVDQDRTREFDRLEMEHYVQRFWSVEKPHLDAARAQDLVRGLLAAVPDDPLTRQAQLAKALAKAARSA
ncbi:trypsin-like serine peptidase [Polaromonas naphthalenivorans]|uniref:Uncharacterized protein n=1 Tax=Polaromonas naphthalenivorans (strain CJ2) TaxID=365044 RepID=A1VVN7_POLNA|nr:serine protease [Polaromonas naphthalenivorans]ABM39715.1 hypothetical protein Pnap_4438 [Polaromonas naphthalenivorans CJ2]